MTQKFPAKLSECILDSNCLLVEWNFNNIDKAFENLVRISTNLPRTKVIKVTNNYWHGICRSLVFRFPDDLEILKISSEKIIQVKSSSRVGMSDLGVNRLRINKLYNELMKNG
tara:strand:+ start:2353 stop:2691 length:339 start_codon:yes stop_codon:yes gene_type:complete